MIPGQLPFTYVIHSSQPVLPGGRQEGARRAPRSGWFLPAAAILPRAVPRALLQIEIKVRTNH